MAQHRADIRYTHEHAPEGAATIELAPGILWARLPLPFRLNHVNVWLVDDGDGWTLIDTGASTAVARDIWEALFAGPLKGRRINRLIATHGHTDHVGLAGWLVDRCGGVPFVSTMIEWLSATVRITESRAPMRPEVQRFLAGHGCDSATIDAFRADREKTHALLGDMPATMQRLRPGQTIRFGRRDWRVIIAGGHAVEHASFYCEAEKLLIAGDQILSKISPMVGVFPGEPKADPLSDYLASLEAFRTLPAEAYVLPSHGLPFHGLHKRIDQLAAHHAVRLETLAGLMERPAIAMELTNGLFAKAVKEGQGRNALAETLAHAHRLVSEGRARRIEHKDRVLFERIAAG